MKRRNESRVLYAVAVDGQTVTFECKAGHRSRKTYPEAGRNAMPRWLLQRWTSPGGYWAKGSGHLYGPCRACDKAGV